MIEGNSDKRILWRSALGRLHQGESVEWLRALETGSVRLVVADPPYGIGRADWDEFDSSDEYLAWTATWLDEVVRVLQPEGTAYVMGFSEVLADLKGLSRGRFTACRWLVWAYRNRANLRSDWGRSHESILHLRKGRSFTMNVDAVRVPYNAHTRRYPQRAQGSSSQFGQADSPRKSRSWAPHPLGAKPRDVLEIPILNNGMAEKTPHPTQKPEELIRRLVAASSDPGDLVVDPFSGSGTTAVVCELLGRRWLANDQSAEYGAHAVERLDAVEAGEHTIEQLSGREKRMRRNRSKVRGS